LHGVPLTLKECFFLAGTPNTVGLTSSQHAGLADHDGILTRRLRRAGAIVLGKTNVPQLMIWHEADNPVYGRTNNPWDLERTCGGSTGGEAAIIAARGSPLGLGNDLGGSIRVPCHFCGVHGIKPTSFRLPRTGAVRTLRGFEAIVTQAGPMARHVEDLWLGLQVLTDDSDGYVAGDVSAAKIGDPAAVRIDGLKIAMWTADGFIEPSPAIGRAVREAAEALRGAQLSLPVESAPPLEEGEFWAHELAGCAVVDGDRAVGEVRRMVPLPSCEALEVVRADGGPDLLVPMVRDAVRSVDVEARRVDVDLAFLGDAGG